MAMITLIDERRQWFKSQFGLTINETPREIAFCNTTIQQARSTVVEDAFQDPRFAENPLVHSNLGIRFYAGVPLITQDGHAIGTLAVLDNIPRRLLDSQAHALRTLGRSVMNQIELRRLLMASRAAAEADMHAPPVETDVLPGLFFWTDERGKILRCNSAAAGLADFFGTGATIRDVVTADMRTAFNENWQKAIEGTGESFETILVDPETGRLPSLIAVRREVLDGGAYLFWLALPLAKRAHDYSPR